jgi:uncharacterized protein with PQ loop repeat
MILIILIFIACVVWGFAYYCKNDEKESVAIGFVMGIVLAMCMAMVSGILTNTNHNEYYSYTPTELELSAVDGKYVALDGSLIYYIADNHIRSVKTGCAYIKTSDAPHAIYYKYCGFNKENWFRWIYTFPDGQDYIEFYIPDGAISTAYHFGN